MTESQYAHHAEQIEAARRDFQDWWKLESKLIAMQQSSKIERLLVETGCWRAWLAAKGLKK